MCFYNTSIYHILSLPYNYFVNLAKLWGEILSNKQIGERIADLRTDHDMQQGELADILGIHQSALSRIEKGQRAIREDELLRIARHFRVTTDYLLGNDPPLQEGNETYYTHREKEHLRKYRAIGYENEKHVDALLDSFYNAIPDDDKQQQN